MGKLRTFRTEQSLPIDQGTAWKFLSEPKNLSKITPEGMDFEIISEPPETTYPGLIVEYRVRPFLGIPVRWTTEITHVQAPDYFVDEQRFGPYAFWHHKHFLEPVEGGVKMSDLIHYRMPFGPLGDLVHPFLVGPKLKEIFHTREKVFRDLFGDLSPSEKPTDP
jgi:ligand-binding SRPBCC domain-containing protein